MNYISNIYVVNDPGNPENNGGVFLFKYGKKIFDKIYETMNPQFEDEEPINPFDFWKGANFKFKIRQVEGYRNYDKSEFDSPKQLLPSDDDMEEIWNSEYSLLELVDEKNFKSEVQLKERLNKVLAVSGNSETTAHAEDADFSSRASAKPNFKEPSRFKEPSFSEEVDFDDDPDLNYFKSLVD